MADSENIKRWRQKTKNRIVEAFGGCCGICGYNRCHDALELHHLNPEEKDFSLASLRANPKKWINVVLELEKCVMLCAICHREVHARIVEIPENIIRFDEKYRDYKSFENAKFYDECPICGERKKIRSSVCSTKCSGMRRQKVDWSKVDLHDLYFVQKLSKVAIGKMLGCSDNTVSKRLKHVSGILAVP